MLQLIFSRLATPSNAPSTDLIFGEKGAIDPGESKVSAVIVSPIVSVEAIVSYDSQVNRGLSRNINTAFENAYYVFKIYTLIHETNDQIYKRLGLQYDIAIQRYHRVLLSFETNQAVYKTGIVNYDDAISLVLSKSISWIYLKESNKFSLLRYEIAKSIYSIVADNYTYPKAVQNHQFSATYELAKPTHVTITDTFEYVKAVKNHNKGLVWELTQPPWRYLPSELIPPKKRYLLDLIFKCKQQDQKFGETDLIFGKTCETIIYPHIPDRDSILINNEVSVIRDDGKEIKVLAGSVSYEADSWCYQFDLKCDLTQENLVIDQPIITININHLSFVVQVESVDYQHGFNQASMTVKGRSLAHHFEKGSVSKIIDQPITATQIINSQIETIDLITGFELDYRIDDWVIPANLYSYTNSSPLDVIRAPVNAANALLVSHPTEPLFIVKSRYSIMPWAIKDSDVVFGWTDRNILTLSRSYNDGPHFDAVYVSGEVYGVTVFCRRDGTDGNTQAPNVVERLLTEQQACLERGRSIIADSGNREQVTFDMPLYKQTPILYQGDIVKVNDFYGYLRSYAISFSNNGGAVIVRQNLGIERNVEEWL